MTWRDTIHPLRILNTLKRWNEKLGMRGMAGEPPEPPEPPEPNWKDVIPEERRNSPTFEKYTNVADALVALDDAQPLLGREKLPVPSGPDDHVTLDLIADRLGRPKSGDGYEVPTDIQIPKELPLNEPRLASFRTLAHKIRLTPAQFKAIYNFDVQSGLDAHTQSVQAETKAIETADVELHKEWGGAYTQKHALASKVFHQFADDKDYQAFKKVSEGGQGLGNNPILIRLFAKFGSVLSEDMLEGKPATLTQTPAEIQAKLREMNEAMAKDPKHPLSDINHAGHKAAVAERQRLMKLLAGGGGV